MVKGKEHQEYTTLVPEEILTYPSGKGFMGITNPEIAQWLLEHMVNFRKPGTTVINRYATDMRSEKWTPNYADSIVIWRRPDGDIHVVNGQHRLFALLKSGTTQVFAFMITDMDPHDENIDINKVRTPKEYLEKMTGQSDRRAVAICYELLKQQGIHRAQVTRDMSAYAYCQYEDALVNAMNINPVQKHGITIPVLIAETRGYYRGDLPRLAEFAEQVVTGEHAGAGDDGARLLRSVIAFGRAKDASLFYGRCERAVSMFLDKKSNSSRGAVASNLNPVSHPGALLPIPPYDGPGAVTSKEEVKAAVEEVEKKHMTLRSERIAKILIKHPRVLFDNAMLIAEYKKKYDTTLRLRDLSDTRRYLKTLPGFSTVTKNKSVRIKFTPED